MRQNKKKLGASNMTGLVALLLLSSGGTNKNQVLASNNRANLYSY